ncbi:MAG: hypothetical protein EPO61_05785 [Nitrospirae bacterium]|nr:MAG: hypothetical protein EPO61_05785 [Nitrospirota bacterium]
MPKSVAVKTAWIGAVAVVFAAVISGVFSLFSKGGGDSGNVVQEMKDSPQSIQAGRDVNINIGTDRSVHAPSAEKLLPKKQIAGIEFKNEKPFVEQVVLGNESFRGYRFRVQIENKSSETTLIVKHVKLVDLQQLEGNAFKAWMNAEPVYLEWDGTKSTEIPPQDKVLIPFARIYPPELQRITDGLLSGGVDTPQLRFIVQPGTWPRKMTSHIPPGTHRFKVQVFFEKGPPAEIKLELEWPGTRRETPDAMVQEIKITKL